MGEDKLVTDTSKPVMKKGKKGKKLKVLVTTLALLILTVAGIWYLSPLPMYVKGYLNVTIEDLSGQFTSGHAVIIAGEGFGSYDESDSVVTIDGKTSEIVSWTDTSVHILVPADITEGKKKIVIENSSEEIKKIVTEEFTQQNILEVKRVVLSATEDNWIEEEAFTLFVPAGSLEAPTEIVISWFDTPSPDALAYYEVVDEFLITDVNGGHVFFKQPVFLGLPVEKEDVTSSTLQIFDDVAGVWVKADCIYNEEDSMLYMSTTHFSMLRKVMDKLTKKVQTKYDSAVQSLSDAKDYVEDFVVESYDFIKDNTVEQYYSITCPSKRFVVYYRVADVKDNPSIQETAKDMVMAFDIAYDRYVELFGEDKMPITIIKVYRSMYPNIDFKSVLKATSEKNDDIQFYVLDPIKVYLDPRLDNAGSNSGAQWKMATGNIVMPLNYIHEAMEVTCGHELFHAVQYEYLGVSMVPAMRGKDKNSSKWFIEGTAEYAGEYIATNSFETTIANRLGANAAYYAVDGTQEYGISQFLLYITSNRFQDLGNRNVVFKSMWEYVVENDSINSNMNIPVEKYVYELTGMELQNLYETFWRQVATLSTMPSINDEPRTTGTTVTHLFARASKTSYLNIKKHGYGIYRFLVNDKAVPSDNNSVIRSIWFESKRDDIQIDVYKLAGILPEERSNVAIEPLGIGKTLNNSYKLAMVPFKPGDSFGLVAFTTSFSSTEIINLKILPSVSSLKWDNQKDIEKKIENGTLVYKDTLEFTPVLPDVGKDFGETFKAVVVMNDNYDFKTEVEDVKNGKKFTVHPPMAADANMPPDKLSVNIKIYKGDTLVHEYQSSEVIADATVAIMGKKPVTYEVKKEALPLEHTFSAMAAPITNYRFEWNFGDGSAVVNTTGEESEVKHNFADFKEYTVTVTLYDDKNNKLSKDEVKIILKEKEETPDQEEATENNNEATTPTTSEEKTYAWVLTGTKTNDWQGRLATQNKASEGTWVGSVSASGNSADFTWTYVGKDGGQYGDSWLMNGMSEKGSATWSNPSLTTIEPYVEFSVDLTCKHVESTFKYPSAGWMILAQVFYLDEEGNQSGGASYLYNAAGESSFVSGPGNNYQSFSETVTGTIGGGSEEGDKMTVRVSAGGAGTSVETWYIYEWRSQ